MSLASLGPFTRTVDSLLCVFPPRHTAFLNFVDMMSILPFYVQLVIGSNSASSATFRVIRLIRVFRVFKISRYVSWIKTFVNAMVLSAWPLGMLLFVMAIG